MKLEKQGRLLYAPISLVYRGAELKVGRVLVDSGSVTTVFQADLVAGIGIRPMPHDRLRNMWGIGGAEPIYRREVDRISIGSKVLGPWTIDVGAMDYGYEVEAILGTDVLFAIGASIDFQACRLAFPP